MAGLMSPEGVNLPSELVTPFASFATWITDSSQYYGNARIWLFDKYKTADIEIGYIASTVNGYSYYTLYDKNGEKIGNTKQITSKTTIHLNVSGVSYIEISGSADLYSATVCGTVRARR